ncbi:MAG: c-type cytochrome [Vulcanimicrobiaceae bacterium]
MYLAAGAVFMLLGAYGALPARADDGGAIFSAKCAACHTIGRGKTVGPDLKGITSTVPHAFLVQWIESPSALVKAGNPMATSLVKQYPLQMPDLGLSSADVDAVLAYIAQQSGGAAAAAGSTAPVAAMPAGDAGAGREYFVGGLRFHNGGSACMACHSISGIGTLGGGTLGPDLTNAYHTFGGTSGLESILSTVPTPTMNAVWSKNPLTPQEISDVTAFIQEGAVSQRPLDAIAKLALLAIAGLVILLIILGTYWRRRLLGVRIPLVARANMLFNSRFARRS